MNKYYTLETINNTEEIIEIKKAEDYTKSKINLVFSLVFCGLILLYGLYFSIKFLKN